LEIYSKITEVKEFVLTARQNAFSIGFVPTMGALHQGHLNLIKTAHLHTDLVISSIFINPSQFNDKGDFERYPRTLENDIKLLQKAGCHAIFTPSIDEIYPKIDNIIYDFGFLTNTLEGAHRPGHFSGVIKVVKRLFEIIEPNKAYFGKKDYQQFLVIKTLKERFGFFIDIEGCETTRETSGLAMSSRNKLLTEDQRNKATILYNTLLKVKKEAKKSLLEQTLNSALNDLIDYQNLVLDYFVIVDATSLLPIKKWEDADNAMALVAATFGKVRLIDNMILY
jgi:pantoate--beta-alanine ligase